MKKVIASMALLSALFVFGAAQLFKLTPTPTANSVIAEKAENGKMGGQAATVLPETLNSKQHKLLNMAYEVGKANGFKNPEVIQAILLQETHAGGLDTYRVANPGRDAYFGPMQIKLAAARDVLAKWPALYDQFDFHTRTDDEVKANLILNERFNLEVATKYVRILRDTYGLQGRDLMQAYNRGPGGYIGSDYRYVAEAEAKLASWKSKR